MTGLRKKSCNITQDYGLSESAYSYGYDLRLKYSSFMPDTLNWISGNSEELLPIKENPIKILSLGCGSGVFDRKLIKIIQQQSKHWLFTGLDYSYTDLDYFHKSLSSLDNETQKHINLEYRKFTPSTTMDEHYDLITMIHFLHSFDDVLPIINNALNHLLPGGKLLIVQQQKQGISELKEHFSHLLANHKFNCSDQIKLLLATKNIDFTAHDIHSSFNISIMQKMSLDTLLLMSFCFCNDLSILNTQQQTQIRNAFLSMGKKEKAGSLIINERMEAIVCYK